MNNIDSISTLFPDYEPVHEFSIMNLFEKEAGCHPPGTSAFPPLEDPFQDESEASKDSTPKPKRSTDQSISTHSRKRSLRRTVERTKSALRRRTISNPKAMRHLPRRLRFEDHEGGEKRSSASQNEKQEQRDDFCEQLEGQLPAKLSFKQRMRHFTWTWFTMTMATGGIANVL